MGSKTENPTLQDQERLDLDAPSPGETINEIVSRTRSLYSLPAVAVEVIQLTSNLQVDARALKQCIEKDPALTARILRVVNSSLFGLSREVSDLNQALALLGTKPLKLLVLGFSLPEGLFANVAREQLDWYWKTTLVRAVAAREISEQLWNKSGDDAFLAGLLQDIGVLVLLDQLREPYAKFLGRVIEERGNLDAMEVQSLGFDHTTLSARLLRNWNMPDLLVEAITEKQDHQLLVHKGTPAAELARVLHLAGLLSELVGQNRLHVLPELLEAGDAYCGLDNEKLHDIIPVLQDKVQQLAEVLSLDLPAGDEYSQIVIRAHAQMAAITEEVAERLSQPLSAEEKAYERVLEDAVELRSAVNRFLRFPSSTPSVDLPPEDGPNVSAPPASILGTGQADANLLSSVGTKLPQRIAEGLIWAVGKCRSERVPLSFVLVEVKDDEVIDPRERQLFNQIVETACYNVDVDQKRVEILAEQRWGLVLSDCDRYQAVRHAHELIREFNLALQQHAAGEEASRCAVSVGVASVTLPPKNFPPMDLVAAARRCLSAAQLSGTSVVKSLEIF